LLVAPPARRQIDRLPISVAAAVLETLDDATRSITVVAVAHRADRPRGAWRS
jgi:hypothetical protein